MSLPAGRDGRRRDHRHDVLMVVLELLVAFLGGSVALLRDQGARSHVGPCRPGRAVLVAQRRRTRLPKSGQGSGRAQMTSGEAAGPGGGGTGDHAPPAMSPPHTMTRTVERPLDLPDFKAPPVREVAIGVQFERIPALSQAHVGLFWSMIRDDYPVTQDQEPLPSQVEDLSGTPMPPLFKIEFGPTPPLRRAWFLNSDGSRLVQLQQDRLVHNWRYQDEPYPRFEPLAEAFHGFQESFFALLGDLGLPVPKVELVEVTYVNWIPAAWMNEVVTFVTMPSLPDVLSAPDSGALSTRFLVSDEGAPVGRLYLEARSAVSQDAGTLEAGYLLNLTFRAPHQGGGRPEETTRLMLRGREAIVQAFAAFTPEDLHKTWERQQ